MPGRVDPDGICFVCDITFVEAIERDHAVHWTVHFESPLSAAVAAETCSPGCIDTYFASHAGAA
ncbi:hypothetical protein ACT17_32740 [Mycolicibacterium conceptionense]|uniref:Uncharacterized protein n=1 Tax=Mycolicibacterium conceptionense TaxID=451644 RepID=A0A0J8U093_9MYCO|nr:hypothetical protein [Mycolicibacterium conceptionense]KMV13950.1 hypothetical protein ACT17_32740 [Mycolicibacterium conceptionense]